MQNLKTYNKTEHTCLRRQKKQKDTKVNIGEQNIYIYIYIFARKDKQKKNNQKRVEITSETNQKESICVFVFLASLAENILLSVDSLKKSLRLTEESLPVHFQIFYDQIFDRFSALDFYQGLQGTTRRLLEGL